jgi:hypothetical protein
LAAVDDIVAAPGQVDLRAFCREPAGGRQTDAGAAPGDERDFAFALSH